LNPNLHPADDVDLVLPHLCRQALANTAEELDRQHASLAVFFFDEVEVAVSAGCVGHLADFAVHPYVAELSGEHVVDVGNELRNAASVKLDPGTVPRRFVAATTHGICVTRSARHRRTFASLSVVIVDVISANLG